MRKLLEKLGIMRHSARLNGAYKRLLKDDDGQMIIRDIIGFSGLMEFNTGEDLKIVEGRRQMAMHILQHLDLSPEDIAAGRNAALIEEYQNKQITLNEMNQNPEEY